MWFRVSFLVAERTLFLPSAGFALLVAVLTTMIAPSLLLVRRKHKAVWLRVCVGAAVGVACVWQLRIVKRTADWKDDLTLTASALRLYPGNAMSLSVLAAGNRHA